jgi:hypothetical protein
MPGKNRGQIEDTDRFNRRANLGDTFRGRAGEQSGNDLGDPLKSKEYAEREQQPARRVPLLTSP